MGHLCVKYKLLLGSEYNLLPRQHTSCSGAYEYELLRKKKHQTSVPVLCQIKLQNPPYIDFNLLWS